MKLTTLILLLVPFLGHSQEILQKEITADADLSLYDMVQLPGEGFLACGSANSASGDSISAMLVKLGPSLELEWAKRFNMLNKDYFRCIVPAGDGNFLVGGTSRYEFAEDYGGNLYKVDTEGNIIWNRLYAKNYDDLTLGVIPQPDYSLVLVIRHGVYGEPTKIIHTDSSGILLGQFSLSTVNPDIGLVADCATGDASGNTYIGGSAINSVTGNSVFFLAKVSGMSVDWFREYSFNRDYSYLYGIAVLSDGNVAVTGNMADTVYPNVNYAAVIKVDQNDGAVVWAREVKQAVAYNQTGYGIMPLDDAELVLFGQANTANGFQAFATRLDASGEISWAGEYGNGPYNVFSFGTHLPDGRIILGGKNELGGGTYLALANGSGETPCFEEELDLSANPVPVTEYFPLTTTGDPGVVASIPPYQGSAAGLSEETFCSEVISAVPSPVAFSFSIYPVPAGDRLNIATGDPNGNSEFSYEIIGIRGNTIRLGSFRGKTSVTLSGIPAGLYILKIRDGEHGIVSRQNFVIR